MGKAGASVFTPDGSQATLGFYGSPIGVVVDSAGNLYFTTAQYKTIRKVNRATGLVSTLAGTTVEFPFDGGPAKFSNIGNPHGLAIDVNGSIYFTTILTDPYKASLVEKIDTNGIVSIIAGSYKVDPTQVQRPYGDGSAAKSALLYDANWVQVDKLGNFYVAEDNYIRVISVNTPQAPTPQSRRMPQNTIWNFAGDGIDGYTNDGGSITSVQLTLFFLVLVKPNCTSLSSLLRY